MGCTVTKGLSIMRRDIETGVDSEAALLEFGGNDCDYDWPAVAADPMADHQPKTPLALFTEQLREMIALTRQKGMQLSLIHIYILCRAGMPYDDEPLVKLQETLELLRGQADVYKRQTMDQPENGLPDEVLENTDVLVWWAHIGHHLVSDGVAWKVQQRVLRGMGLIVLHSAHLSKPFQLLMGTSCTLK